MWPFRDKQPPPRVQKRLLEHEDRLSEAESDINNLLKRIQKLEGTTYGRKGAEVAAAAKPPETLSKAQLRLQLGIIPGRVPPNLR